MSKQITQRAFSDAKKDRDELRPARGTRLLADAVCETGTCITGVAVKLGTSEALFRKFVRGELQMPLMDLAELAAVDEPLFDALLVKLAALRNKVVIDRNDDTSAIDRTTIALSAAKEAGEAVSIIATAATSNDPSVLRGVVRETNEAIAKLGAAKVDAEVRLAAHYEAVTKRTSPRGAA